jgi:hypothetical protein
MQNTKRKMQNDLQNAKCKMQNENAKGKMQNATMQQFKMQQCNNATMQQCKCKCKMQNAKCKMQNPKCKMQNAKCKMQNAKCKILIIKINKNKAPAIQSKGTAVHVARHMCFYIHRCQNVRVLFPIAAVAVAVAVAVAFSY